MLVPTVIRSLIAQDPPAMGPRAEAGASGVS